MNCGFTDQEQQLRTSIKWEKGHVIGADKKYCIEEHKGDFVFGRAYTAFEVDENGNPSSNNLVVIRVVSTLNEDERGCKGFLEQFMREVEASLLIKSNNLACSIESFAEENLLCLVVLHEFGTLLSEYIFKEGCLSQKSSIVLFKKIAAVLECLHERGLVHCDVCPSNIILRDEDREPILIDFGSAKSYLYKRRFYGQHPEPRYDIYFLAETLYFSVTAQLPPPYSSRMEKDELQPPHELNQDLSRAFSKVILEGLALNPGDRPSSVQEWVELLSRLMLFERYEQIRDSSYELGALTLSISQSILRFVFDLLSSITQNLLISILPRLPFVARLTFPLAAYILLDFITAFYKQTTFLNHFWTVAGVIAALSSSVFHIPKLFFFLAFLVAFSSSLSLVISIHWALFFVFLLCVTAFCFFYMASLNISISILHFIFLFWMTAGATSLFGILIGNNPSVLSITLPLSLVMTQFMALATVEFLGDSKNSEDIAKDLVLASIVVGTFLVRLSLSRFSDIETESFWNILIAIFIPSCLSIMVSYIFYNMLELTYRKVERLVIVVFYLITGTMISSAIRGFLS